MCHNATNRRCPLFRHRSINYGYYFVIHLVFQLLIWLFGAALGISMFLLTQPGVIVLFYILFTNVQIAIAFLFNALFSSSKTATVLTVVYVIISGLLGEFLLKCARHGVLDRSARSCTCMLPPAREKATRAVPSRWQRAFDRRCKPSIAASSTFHCPPLLLLQAVHRVNGLLPIVHPGNDDSCALLTVPVRLGASVMCAASAANKRHQLLLRHCLLSP